MLLNLFLLASVLAAQEPTKIIVEPDQTDIYAIPLDEDAQDQQEELKELEHPRQPIRF